MSWKTLIEKFGNPEDVTSPFDALTPQGEGEGQQAVIVVATPEAPVAQQPEVSGTTLQMPAISNTKTVQVHKAPEMFKGELPHLAETEHKSVIDWFEKHSVDPNTPAEVRMYLLEIVMKLKSDAIKRIPDEEPVQEGLFRSALEKVGLAKPEPTPVAEVPKELTTDEIFSKNYPPSEYRYEYQDPETGTWKVWHKTMWEPTQTPKGVPSGEGFAWPKRFGLDKFEMALGSKFPGKAKLSHRGGAGYDKLPGVPWRTIWKDKVLYSGVA